MTTETKLEWQVVRGFGDIVNSPADCFDVEVVATFKNETDAQVFADLYYETNIGDIQEHRPDWWKSFFVTVRKADTTPTADEVAQRFDAVLREWLTEAEYAEMLRRNRTREYGGNVCASHDFCDANMAMQEAFESLGIDPDESSWWSLWDAAWNAWRKSK